MKYLLILAIFAAVIILLSMNRHPEKNDPVAKYAATENAGTFEPVAVIELFTSQGCSSCPSADKLLAQTINDAEKKGTKIFALSFHVDYWNRLGWKDPFSTRAFSERQSEYASKFRLSGPYTPQMVVNGNYEFVGSDNRSLDRALMSALNQNTQVSFSKLKTEWETGEQLKVKYEIDGNYKGSVINFALVSTTETTVIKRGENGGRTLRNENVVREWMSTNAASSGEIKFPALPAALAKENLRLIAYVQNRDSYAVTGAAITLLK